MTRQHPLLPRRLQGIVLAASVASCADDRDAAERDAAATPGDATLVDAGLVDSSTPLDGGVVDASPYAADASRDASVDAGGPPRFVSKPLAQPPSYQGSLNNSAACSTSYKTTGFVPDGPEGARYPLLLYFTGTAFSNTDLSSRYDNAGAAKVTEAMARRGFVALSAAYDNTPLSWLSDHEGLLSCLFGSANTQSLLAAACALPQVDCSLGIGTWGHSLGRLVAHMAFNGDARVRGAWTTGYGGAPAATLSKHRLRVVNGETDSQNGMASSLNVTTGLTPTECTEPDQCLRSDGSGWIIVRARELQNPGATADHCWFDRAACTAGALALEPSWIDPASSKPFALERNADWLARTVLDAQLP